MSEKKYLLTESDVGVIKRLECEWCVDNASGNFNCAEGAAAKQARFLEAHEYHERTCRFTASVHGDEAFYRCSECERIVWIDFIEHPLPNYCPFCGAKVVEE